MTRRLARLFSAHTVTPAWAVHFHNDGPHGDSAACFDARCGLPPLTVSDRTRFAPAPPSPPAGRPVPAASRPRRSRVAARSLTA